MECLSCDSTNFRIQLKWFIPEILGITINVHCKAMICEKCGTGIMDDAMMDILRRRAIDSYRAKYGLLLSDDIRCYREKMKMSQEEFDKHLKVKLGSVRRWETYFTQDSEQDKKIRLSMLGEDSPINWPELIGKRDQW